MAIASEKPVCRWCKSTERDGPLIKVPEGYQCAALFCKRKKLVMVPGDVGRRSMAFRDMAK